jgi:hypothetical protein
MITHCLSRFHFTPCRSSSSSQHSDRLEPRSSCWGGALWRPCNFTPIHSLIGLVGQLFASRLGDQQFASGVCTNSQWNRVSPVSAVSLQYVYLYIYCISICLSKYIRISLGICTHIHIHSHKIICICMYMTRNRSWNLSRNQNCNEIKCWNWNRLQIFWFRNPGLECIMCSNPASSQASRNCITLRPSVVPLSEAVLGRLKSPTIT